MLMLAVYLVAGFIAHAHASAPMSTPLGGNPVSARTDGRADGADDDCDLRPVTRGWAGLSGIVYSLYTSAGTRAGGRRHRT